MAARLQRSTPYLLCLGILLAGVVAGVAAIPRAQAHGLDPFAAIVLAVAAVSVVASCVVVVEPAWILTAGLMLSVFSGFWSDMSTPIPLDRVAIFSGLAAVLWRSWRDRDAVRIEVRPVHWLMLGLVLYAIVSAAWAGTLGKHGPLFALLDRLGLVPFLLFLVAPVAFHTERQRRILAGGMLVLGAYLGLVTLFEALHADSLVIPSYILNPDLGVHAERARGPFLEAGANGLALFQCAVAAVLAAWYWRERWVKLSAGIVLVLCVAGLVFTETRQTWVAAAAGAIAAMLVDRRLRRWLPLTAGVSAVVVVLALAFVPGLQSSVSQRAADQVPVWDRLNSDAAALRMFEARPGLGFGWGRFGADSGPYYRLASTYPLTSVGIAHNMALSNASELGFTGVALWVVIMVAAIVVPAARRLTAELEPWRLALIAIAVAWFIQSNFTPLDYAFDNYVVWLFAGIVALGVARRRAREPAAALMR